MTPSEFKAWFDGFTEALDGTPSEDQWKRIKARVAEIDGRPITEHIYTHRYLPYYYATPYYGPLYGGAVWTGRGGLMGATGGLMNDGGSSNGTCLAVNGKTSFNSHAAMATLGRAEALAGQVDGISA